MDTDLAKKWAGRLKNPRITPPFAAWKPSRRDKVEGVVAYSMLGAVVFGMLYVALHMAATLVG
ncbi:MAG: hypothetical protein ABI190_07755 [Casimicrobiaceae bacterium]